MIYLEHCLYYLFAKHNFICYLKQNELEKELNNGLLPLATCCLSHILLKGLSCSSIPPVVLEYETRIQTHFVSHEQCRTEVFQELAWLWSTGDTSLLCSVVQECLFHKESRDSGAFTPWVLIDGETGDCISAPWLVSTCRQSLCTQPVISLQSCEVFIVLLWSQSAVPPKGSICVLRGGIKSKFNTKIAQRCCPRANYLVYFCISWEHLHKAEPAFQFCSGLPREPRTAPLGWGEGKRCFLFGA